MPLDGQFLTHFSSLLSTMEAALEATSEDFLHMLLLLSLHLWAPQHPTLSLTATTKVDFALNHAWADSMLWKYRGIITQFHSFCEAENIARHNHLPADEHLLCAFTASRIGSLSGGTVLNQMAPLKAWHIFNDAPWLGRSCLRYVINSVSNLTPQASRRPSRPPGTHSMLLALAQNLTLSDPLTMWGQVRLGEILSPWEGSFKPLSTVCCHHLHPAFNANGSHKCHLPFTKVAKSKGEDIIICHQWDNLDPISTLEIHLTINPMPANSPLFSYLSLHGWRCLTKKNFLAHCNTVWSAAGLPTTGHSFRIGGTTEFLLAGVSPDIVKALGRWSSDAFLRYWRSLELLTPLHVEQLHSAP